MLSNISWFQFFLAAAAVIAGYYLFLFAPWKHIRRPAGAVAASNAAAEVDDAMPEEDEFPEDDLDEADQELAAAEELAARVREIIADTGQGNFVREELLMELRDEIALYPVMNKGEYRAAFNELIREEVQKKCAVVLSPGEVDGLWR